MATTFEKYGDFLFTICPSARLSTPFRRASLATADGSALQLPLRALQRSRFAAHSMLVHKYQGTAKTGDAMKRVGNTKPATGGQMRPCAGHLRMRRRHFRQSRNLFL
jgi:hypothetical protein